MRRILIAVAGVALVLTMAPARASVLPATTAGVAEGFYQYIQVVTPYPPYPRYERFLNVRIAGRIVLADKGFTVAAKASTIEYTCPAAPTGSARRVC
jgi:hypothetical protein